MCSQYLPKPETSQALASNRAAPSSKGFGRVPVQAVSSRRVWARSVLRPNRLFQSQPNATPGCCSATAGARFERGLHGRLDSGPVLPEQSPIPRDAIAGATAQLADAVDQTSELLMAATELHRKVADLHATLTEALVELERVLAESTTGPNG